MEILPSRCDDQRKPFAPGSGMMKRVLIRGRQILTDGTRIRSHHDEPPVISVFDPCKSVAEIPRSVRGAASLVCCPGNNMVCVALKTARHPGATKARCRCGSQLRSNAGAELFSAQPFRPQSFGRRPVLLARPVSRPIQALRSRLGRRPNPKRRTPCYFPGQHTRTPATQHNPPGNSFFSDNLPKHIV